MSGIEHSRWVRSGVPAAANCYDAVTDHLPARFLIEAASGHWPEMQKSGLINKKIASTKCAHISSDNLLKSRSRASTSE